MIGEKNQLKNEKKKKRKKAYLGPMELAREIVTSWRELRGKITKYVNIIDHPPSEQSLAAGVSLTDLSYCSPSFIHLYPLCERQIHNDKKR